ncbi:MAG: hypothetical protein JST52_07685 [Bacteroidetes bacterium]|nr:hypothetical protein [Bacteroidota bacterium]MBS1741147.1 hypothetical protein [Bacteroidota bacterium]
MKKGTIFLVAFGITIAIGAFVAVFLWNKPHETVDNQQAIQLSADSVVDAFQKNEASANALYLEKVINVHGKIAELDKNQDGNDVILLETGDPMSGVQCTMRDRGGNYKVGNEIAIKGFCHGYTTVVLLSDCIVSK